MNKLIRSLAFLLLASMHLVACGQASHPETSKAFQEMNQHKEAAKDTTATAHKLEVATFGAGCFWCTEAQFEQLKGVEKVESGYSGGEVANPTYKQVCTGNTGHAEVTNVYYDPTVISYDELLAAFWTSHDPTQLNKQGNDVGTQYRSAIFYHNEEQRKLAEGYKKKLNDEKAYNGPVVTEVSPFTVFYKAEDYHQDYYEQNSNDRYCQYVIQPKLDKFKKVFKDKLKK